MHLTGNTRHRLALIALVVLALLWGYNWVVMKVAVHDAPPFVFAATRALGGGMVLFVVALLLRRRVVPQRPGAFLWIGLFQTGIFVGLVTWAVVSAGAGQVAMLAYTMPLWVALIAWPVLGERIGVVHAVAILIAFLGIACMIGPQHRIGFPQVLAVLAGVSWAIGVVIAKVVQRDRSIDLFNLTMWQLIFGGIALAVVALAVPGRPVVWDAPYLFAVAYNIVLATALAYFLWIFVLNELPARDASMGTLANPVIGVVAAWIQLGETPTLLSGIGMVLVLLGLAVVSLAPRGS
ncbi:MAG: EamA family transporter [Candidatus Eremiobacteraeota bacterium]|nr:EamA family transporter [Candidatus Eremiobacteraeota bacterium]